MFPQAPRGPKPSCSSCLLEESYLSQQRIFIKLQTVRRDSEELLGVVQGKFLEFRCVLTGGPLPLVHNFLLFCWRHKPITACILSRCCTVESVLQPLNGARHCYHSPELVTPDQARVRLTTPGAHDISLTLAHNHHWFHAPRSLLRIPNFQKPVPAKIVSRFSLPGATVS